MRIMLLFLLLAGVAACEPEKPRVEDTMFQHAIEYTDKAESAETTLMQGAEDRRQAIEEQEQ